MTPNLTGRALSAVLAVIIGAVPVFGQEQKVIECRFESTCMRYQAIHTRIRIFQPPFPNLAKAS